MPTPFSKFSGHFEGPPSKVLAEFSGSLRGKLSGMLPNFPSFSQDSQAKR